MFSGSPEMIALWVKTIAASRLPEDEKWMLLNARRKDGLAAFYVAMSDGEEERITAFMKSVLASNLSVLYKNALLEAEKPVSLTTLQQHGREFHLAETAREQALRTEAEWKKRMAHHSVAGKVGYDMHEKILGSRDRKARPSLVPVFDQLISSSSLELKFKSKLTGKSAASF